MVFRRRNLVGLLFSMYSLSALAVETRVLQVDTYASGTQRAASVAMDAAGDFVVIWESSDQDESDNGIYGQRYNAAGQRQGAEFRVNTTPQENQSRPAVAMDADGDFVVTWQSNAQENGHYSIYGQRYNAAGEPQDAEFRVNTHALADHYYTAVAMDGDGDFVVTWQHKLHSSEPYGVYAQRYNAAGQRLGAEFRVNATTTAQHMNATVAMDADGDFVVAWESNAQENGLYSIYGQRYNAAGEPQGAVVRVNTYTSEDQKQVAVAMDADGDFVVTWESYGQDGHYGGVYAQRYRATGERQGAAFQVNTFTSAYQGNPAVAIDADGDFVVTWESNMQDGDQYGIYGQRYNAAGQPQGSEFKVNTQSRAQQANPAVAMDADGGFVVAWESDEAGYLFGIYAQRYNALGQAQ